MNTGDPPSSDDPDESDTRDPKTLFGRYNDFVRLFLGFILTGLIGGSITYYYQRNERLSADETARAQADIDRSTKIHEDVTALFGNVMASLLQYQELRRIAANNPNIVTRHSYIVDMNHTITSIVDANRNLNARNHGIRVSIMLEYGKEITNVYQSTAENLELLSYNVGRNRYSVDSGGAYNPSSIKDFDDGISEQNGNTSLLDLNMSDVLLCKQSIRITSKFAKRCYPTAPIRMNRKIEEVMAEEIKRRP